MMRSLLVLSFLIVFSAQAQQTFPIGSINCDSSVRAVFLGDSIVSGAGDTKNNERGGYVKRLGNRYRNLHVTNVGKYGYTTARLLDLVRAAFRENNNTAIAFKRADLIMLDAGRNDCKTHKNAIRAVSTLESIVSLLQAKTNAYVVIATNAPTTVTQCHRNIVRAINQRLLAKNSARFPVRIRFDALPTSILSSDKIHPSSAGYDRMSRTVSTYFERALPRDTQSRRLDSDGDLLTDWCEANIFGTDGTSADTDNDTVSDNDEESVALIQQRLERRGY